MKVALVHDWLTGMRGGEKCLEAACELFPEADIFTLIHRKGTVSKTIERRRIVTSFLQRLPGVHRYYRYLLPLYPAAIERFDLSGYDLVLSMSHAAAKGAIPPPEATHACYCFSPMRYVWDLYDDYFGKTPGPIELVISFTASRLRTWDVCATARVDASRRSLATSSAEWRATTAARPRSSTPRSKTSISRSSCWRLRGKLDVPKERFVSYAGCERGADPTTVVAWAGWNHLEQAKALGAYYVQMLDQEGWGAERLVPLLAGIVELLRWLRQWHNEIDPEYGVRMGDLYGDFVREEKRKLGLTEEKIRQWQPV